MLANLVAKRLAQRNIHYGWVVAAVAFLTMLATSGAVGLPGALILPLAKEFGWDVGGISSALAVRLVLFGLMGPFAAALIERYGVRNIVLTAVALIAAGLLGATLMTQLWQLFMLWGVVVGIGTGLTALVLGAIVSSRWFTRHRGLVLGLMTASASTGQLAFLPLAAWLVEHVSWRTALVPSIAGLAIAALLVLLFMRDRPSDVGLLPYGETGPMTAAAPAKPAIAVALGAFREGSRSSTFWILAATFFICGLSTNGLVQTHFIALCADFGMPQVAAASALAMMGAFDIVGTILSGWLSDRFDNRWLLFWYYGLRGLSLIYLPSSSFTIYGLSLFALFYGLDWIATVPPTVKLAGATFGREKAGLIFGWVFAAHQVGAAVAAFGAGFTRSELSTYLPAFYTAGIACLVAAVLAIAIRKARRTDTSGAQPVAA
ncbi:MAG TPA: MFS transporter [Stellaceae bacterium]|nr:MFS transporter [Stellaceae bacterium]